MKFNITLTLFVVISAFNFLFINVCFFINIFLSNDKNYKKEIKFLPILLNLFYFSQKSLLYFIYLCRSESTKNKVGSEVKRIEKTYLYKNRYFIFIVSLIDFIIYFFFFQILSLIKNNFIFNNIIYFNDTNFFYCVFIYFLSPKILQYRFYKQHFFAMFLLFINSIYYYLKKKYYYEIFFIIIIEFLLALKEIIEKYSMKKNKTDYFLIISFNGIINTILGIIYIISLYFFNNEFKVYLKNFTKFNFFFILEIINIYFFISYEILRLKISKDSTPYIRLFYEKYFIIIYIIYGILYNDYKIYLSILFYCIQYFGYILFCDIIELNFESEKKIKKKKNYINDEEEKEFNNPENEMKNINFNYNENLL